MLLSSSLLPHKCTGALPLTTRGSPHVCTPTSAAAAALSQAGHRNNSLCAIRRRDAGRVTVQAATFQRDPAPTPEGSPVPEVYTSLDESTKNPLKPRLVVLGSGWGATSFIKSLPPSISEMYEVLLISPRNYFCYTPLLPSVATGTVEERSIVENVRSMIVGKADYYEALCKDVDVARKELVCCFPADAGFDEACFKVSYDVLVMGVGCVNNTFGIKGISEHCNLFKSLEDAKALRLRVSECFERASLPQTPPEERERLLSFVIVGGGPTGVEVAAELYDMINDDLSKLYPKLIRGPESAVKIRVIELQDHVLSTYDRAISNYTAEIFRRGGIELVLNSRVSSVDRGIVSIVDKQNNIKEVKFGACVWATGVAMNPLVKSMQKKLAGQNHFRSILTNEFLEVKGSKGSIFAFGDAATIEQPTALNYAEELFKQGDTDGDNTLSVEELRVLLLRASEQFPHLREHAEYLNTLPKGPGSTFGALAFPRSMARRLAAGGGPASPLAELNGSSRLSLDQFADILKAIDSGLRALPATAQVAKQQGEYLASILSRHRVTGQDSSPEMAALKLSEKPFKYTHKGSTAYVGRDSAVFDIPNIGPWYGTSAGVVWKSFETYSQFSLRNQILVASDFVRTKIFGRDISRV